MHGTGERQDIAWELALGAASLEVEATERRPTLAMQVSRQWWR